MYCPHCGNEVKNSAVYCHVCGQPVRENGGYPGSSYGNASTIPREGNAVPLKYSICGLAGALLSTSTVSAFIIVVFNHIAKNNNYPFSVEIAEAGSVLISLALFGVCLYYLQRKTLGIVTLVTSLTSSILSVLFTYRLVSGGSISMVGLEGLSMANSLFNLINLVFTAVVLVMLSKKADNLPLKIFALFYLAVLLAYQLLPFLLMSIGAASYTTIYTILSAFRTLSVAGLFITLAVTGRKRAEY